MITCLPYILEYQDYYELDCKVKNLVEIIKYGNYHLENKNLKNITSVVYDLGLQRQTKLLKKVEKKYFSLQSKKKQTLSWKNKPSIKIPNSILEDSILTPKRSIKVAGKLRTKRKQGTNNLSYQVSIVSNKKNKKKPTYEKSQGKSKGKEKATRKRKQSGGSESAAKKTIVGPSVRPRALVVEPKLIPTSPKLVGVETFEGGTKKNQRLLFRLDFKLPDGKIQKLFFKVSLAPEGTEGEILRPFCVNITKCNNYIYESNVYHVMNLKTKDSLLHQNILDIYGFGYTNKSNPVFSVNYDSSTQKIIGTHHSLNDNIQTINLTIPEHIQTYISQLVESLEILEGYSSTHISYNITEYLDNYIPLGKSKKINTENKVVKVILSATGILTTLYNNYGFVHGDLHDLNYLVKDEEVPEGELPLDFVKFYDFDLSMLVKHEKLTSTVENMWLGYVTDIYREIYHIYSVKSPLNDLLLFGKLLSLFDFYRIFCNCSLTHPDEPSTLFDFTGMNLFANIYLTELSGGKRLVSAKIFVKIFEILPTVETPLHKAVLELAIEFKRDIIDDNRAMLQSRFTSEEYQIVKGMLVKGFEIQEEFYPFTLPWCFTTWCVWTDGEGNFVS